MIISLQPSAYTDQITEDGTELTKLPYPYHVSEDGSIGRQDFWRGDPTSVVGFAQRLDVHKVDLWWRDVVKNPQAAVGMYLITRDDHGGMATHQAAISSVEVHETP